MDSEGVVKACVKACLITTSFDNHTWFIGTYSVHEVDIEPDDLSMVASPVFGGPLVTIRKTGHTSRRGTMGLRDEECTYYDLSLLSCGPEDACLVLKHLGDLLKEGKLPLPKHEAYYRYRHYQLEGVEEWFRHPRTTAREARLGRRQSARTLPAGSSR